MAGGSTAVSARDPPATARCSYSSVFARIWSAGLQPAKAGRAGTCLEACGRCVDSSRPPGGRSRQALPQPDLSEPRQRQGVPAVAAIERDDPPTIREHVPRRLPVDRGNKTASTKQTRGEAFHTSRTEMIIVTADGLRAHTPRSMIAAKERFQQHMFPLRTCFLSTRRAGRAGGAERVRRVVEAAAISGVSRLTHCTAIPVRLSVRSCDHRRVHDNRSLYAAGVATCSTPLHRDRIESGTERHS